MEEENLERILPEGRIETENKDNLFKIIDILLSEEYSITVSQDCEGVFIIEYIRPEYDGKYFLITKD